MLICLAAIAIQLRRNQPLQGLDQPGWLARQAAGVGAMSLVEQAEARIGQPIQVMWPFELRAQAASRQLGARPLWRPSDPRAL